MSHDLDHPKIYLNWPYNVITIFNYSKKSLISNTLGLRQLLLILGDMHIIDILDNLCIIHKYIYTESKYNTRQAGIWLLIIHIRIAYIYRCCL